MAIDIHARTVPPRWEDTRTRCRGDWPRRRQNAREFLGFDGEKRLAGV